MGLIAPFHKIKGVKVEASFSQADVQALLLEMGRQLLQTVQDLRESVKALEDAAAAGKAPPAFC